MKKILYIMSIIVLISLLLYNLYYIVINIFTYDIEIITIKGNEIDQKEYELIYSKLKDTAKSDEKLEIQKCILRERFPTGGCEIKIYYKVNDYEKETTIFETERGGNPTPISDYIKEKGAREYPYKSRYKIALAKVIALIISIFVIILIPIIVHKYKKN